MPCGAYTGDRLAIDGGRTDCAVDSAIGRAMNARAMTERRIMQPARGERSFRDRLGTRSAQPARLTPLRHLQQIVEHTRRRDCRPGPWPRDDERVLAIAFGREGELIVRAG